MGLFGCCNGDIEESKKELDDRSNAIDIREREVRERENKLQKDIKKLEDEKKKNQGVNNASFQQEIPAEVDRELQLLRSQNASLTQEVNKKNKEINDLSKKVKAISTVQEVSDLTTVSVAPRRRIEEAADPTDGKAVVLKRVSKSAKTTTMLKTALRNCDLLKALDITHIEAIVEVMQQTSYTKDDVVIREGTDAVEMYVLEHGDVEVSHDEGDGKRQVIHKMTAGATLGEIALLFNTKRTANVIALNNCTIWSINRSQFKKIMQNTNETEYIDRSTFLRRISILRHLSDYEVAKIAHVADRETYQKNQYIVREGFEGETFYIIVKGKCAVYQLDEKTNKQMFLRELAAGTHFGEKALMNKINSNKRTATVQASTEVQVLTLEKKDVLRLIGNIPDNYSARPDPDQGYVAIKKQPEADKDPDISLANLATMSILGEGGFGKVELVKVRKQNRFYARKRVARTKINKKDMELEKTIMQTSECKFIVKLFYTLTDSHYVYLLMEPCLGGELWTHLKKHKRFPEDRAQFYVACTIEAIQFLHLRKIVYRDIKPENLLIDRHGYAKLADFGLARITQPGSKRWTCCGTPEYMAPEVLLKYGHDFSVDYWALGVLIYELTMGEPPFKSPKFIMKGIDVATFPNRITRPGKDIVKALVQVNPSKRLGNFKGGIDEIKNHRWFQAFDWQGLQKRTINAPWEPILRTDWDTRYFDQQNSDRTTGM